MKYSQENLIEICLVEANMFNLMREIGGDLKSGISPCIVSKLPCTASERKILFEEITQRLQLSEALERENQLLKRRISSLESIVRNIAQSHMAENTY